MVNKRTGTPLCRKSTRLSIRNGTFLVGRSGSVIEVRDAMCGFGNGAAPCPFRETLALASMHARASAAPAQLAAKPARVPVAPSLLPIVSSPSTPGRPITSAMSPAL